LSKTSQLFHLIKFLEQRAGLLTLARDGAIPRSLATVCAGFARTDNIPTLVYGDEVAELSERARAMGKRPYCFQMASAHGCGGSGQSGDQRPTMAN
jgi:hypothetical protein